MNRLPALSIAMIVLDEGPRLVRLLPRLAWAGEVLVVDGGSRDDSIAIARRYGARVVERRFDRFAAQRNFAIDQARGTWVLSLDADETPSPALVHELARTLAAPRHAAYRVPIRSRIFGRAFRYSGTQDDRPLRLFRRDTARWEGDVHEQLRPSGSVGSLGGWLEHDTLADVPMFLAKMRRYTALSAAARIEAGASPRAGEQWIAPAWEVYRRLVLKLGLLDGPQGWLFCLLSGLSTYTEIATVHRTLRAPGSGAGMRLALRRAWHRLVVQEAGG
ncbi:MAG: glycosyltransferase family 2 protein [Pirellulales bacterium]|nr:glycosyltransferase family 2 protein [Pirellulales bacterium]